MISRAQIMSNPRHAGGVKRYHTWPTITTQTVADHTWHVMRIWWALFGPLPPEISTYLLWHDAGELATGDVPFPVKSKHQYLKMQMEFLEAEGVLRIGGPLGFPAKLPQRDKDRAKVCDLIEMMEYGFHEMTLGNRYAQPVVDDLRAVLGKFKLEPEDAGAVKQYLDKFDKEVALVFNSSP